MTPQSGNAENMFETIWTPVNNYRVLLGVASATATFAMVEQGLGWLSLLPLVFAALAATGRSAVIPIMYLALILVTLSMNERQIAGFFRQRSQAGLWILGVTTLIFLIAAYRIQGLVLALFPAAQQRESWRNRLRFRWWLRDPSRPARPRTLATSAPSEFWSVLAWSVISFAAAQIAIRMATPETIVYLVVPVPVLHAIHLVWLGGLLVVVSATVISHFAWRLQSLLEAGTYLRSVVWRWHYNEWRSVERYWSRRRRRGG